MIITMSTAADGAMLAGLLALLDADPAPARLQLYGLGMPAAGGTPAGPVQAEIVLARPAGAVDAATTLTLFGPLEGQRTAPGAITWARLLNGSGTWVMDLDVTATGLPPESAGAVQLDTITGYPGSFVRLVSAAIGY